MVGEVLGGADGLGAHGSQEQLLDRLLARHARVLAHVASGSTSSRPAYEATNVGVRSWTAVRPARNSQCRAFLPGFQPQNSRLRWPASSRSETRDRALLVDEGLDLRRRSRGAPRRSAGSSAHGWLCSCWRWRSSGSASVGMRLATWAQHSCISRDSHSHWRSASVSYAPSRDQNGISWARVTTLTESSCTTSTSATTRRKWRTSTRPAGRSRSRPDAPRAARRTWGRVSRRIGADATPLL